MHQNADPWLWCYQLTTLLMRSGNGSCVDEIVSMPFGITSTPHSQSSSARERGLPERPPGGRFWLGAIFLYPLTRPQFKHMSLVDHQPTWNSEIFRGAMSEHRYCTYCQNACCQVQSHITLDLWNWMILPAVMSEYMVTVGNIGPSLSEPFPPQV